MGHRQHGSDMIEPAALAKPIIVGPFTTNFADAMRWLRASSAIREIATADQLQEQMQQLLAGPEQATAMGARARQVVIDQQGATDRHAEVIIGLLDAQ
jgi:3-deoxy-D-manno-octulosonic-acid transferase